MAKTKPEDGANGKDAAPVEPDPKVESNVEAKPDEYAQLQAELEAEKKRRAELEETQRDLRSRLTKEQQVRAEWERYHTQTLPKINKKFEEHWDENPEGAVQAKVDERVVPLNSELSQIKAENALNSILISHPDWIKYRDRVISLSFDHPALSYDSRGIEQLFRIARSEDLEKEVSRLKNGEEAERQKERAVTESPGKRETPKPKLQLSEAQMHVAKSLGISPEEYAKNVGLGRTLE